MATLTRFEPYRDVSSLNDEVERVFRQTFGSPTATSAGAFSPALDVEETEDGFTLHVELPGVRPEDVDVSLKASVLTITGERPFYEGKNAEHFRRIERHVGRFHRAVRLPDRVDGTGVAATYRDGLLTITVPKAEEAKPRRIQVTTG
jgi:HSP20 family protein